MKRYSKTMSKTKKYINAIYVIVLKTLITIIVFFKNAVITHKVEFIIIIIDIAISGEDTSL